MIQQVVESTEVILSLSRQSDRLRRQEKGVRYAGSGRLIPISPVSEHSVSEFDLGPAPLTIDPVIKVDEGFRFDPWNLANPCNNQLSLNR